MKRRAWRMAVGGLLLGALATTGGLALADVAPGNVGYDGKFVFVRLRYDMPRGVVRGLFGGDLPWAHDYPRAERNFSKILEAVTYINPFLGPNGGNILMLDDPELFKFPFAYMSEPGYWEMSEAEAEGLRSYLLKGGFMIFDDFTGNHWDNFTRQLRRVLPRCSVDADGCLAPDIPFVLRHRGRSICWPGMDPRRASGGSSRTTTPTSG